MCATSFCGLDYPGVNGVVTVCSPGLFNVGLRGGPCRAPALLIVVRVTIRLYSATECRTHSDILPFLTLINWGGNVKGNLGGGWLSCDCRGKRHFLWVCFGGGQGELRLISLYIMLTLGCPLAEPSARLGPALDIQKQYSGHRVRRMRDQTQHSKVHIM